MCKFYPTLLLYLIVLGYIQVANAQTPVISGELKKWNKITITFDGPMASENDVLNPFTDYALNVTFKNGSTTYVVPGYFAADGNAATTSAIGGNKWRVHFNAPLSGTWTYTVSFEKGTNVAIDPSVGVPFPPLNGIINSFVVTETDKSGKDFRSEGILEHLNEHYFKFKGTGRYFLKNGCDSPENFLAFWEFDNTQDNPGGLATNLPDGLHHYEPHLNDWIAGNPTWKNGKGKGIIGAVNYLSSEEVNSQYFLVMNVNGDGREVYPWTSYTERIRYDISKLAQWEIVFEHMQKMGLLLHVVLQESENDKILNQGNLGVERKIYYRELIARFAHHNALYWNLGEETNRSTAQIKADAAFFKTNDPYKHPVKVHSKAGTTSADNLYNPLLGDINYDATSLQQPHTIAHTLPINWRTKSAQAGFKWVIEHDEVNGGVSTDNASVNNHNTMRKNVIWGNLIGGGGGSEWYFPYNASEAVDDIDCENFRSRNLFWDYGRYAAQFFFNYVPFYEMQPMDALINNSSYNWVLASTAKKKYVVFLSKGGSATINLPAGNWSVRWFNPRTGGAPSASSDLISGNLRAPDSNDWVALIDVKGVSNPIVNLISPISGNTFLAGTNVNINADATDVDGIITKVTFYANNIVINEDISFPYSFVWNTPTPGVYNIMARAIDNSGLTATDNVTITILPNGNLVPFVALTSPVENTGFNSGDDILINADANDPDGSIVRVEFYNGANLLSIDNSSPYSFLWQNVSSGNFTIIAKAVDNSNSSSMDSVHVLVNFEMEDTYLLSFTLINTETDLPIAGYNPIVNGSVINLANTGTFINIRANVDFSPIGSVKFNLNGRSFRSENVAPYALAGDNLGNYNIWNAPLGLNRIEAQAYSGSNSSGTLLDTLSLTITIINSASRIAQVNTAPDDSVTIFPNPFINEFTFKLRESEKIKELILSNSVGTEIEVSHDCIEKSICKVKTKNPLPEGEYFLKVRSKSGIRVVRIVKQEGLNH